MMTQQNITPADYESVLDLVRRTEGVSVSPDLLRKLEKDRDRLLTATVSPKCITSAMIREQGREQARCVARRRAEKRPLGVGTGIPALDHQLGGYLRARVHTLLGSTGTGKTALALQIARSCGAPAVYLTCEITPCELWQRCYASLSGRDIREYETGPAGRQSADELSQWADDVEYEIDETADAYALLNMLDATEHVITPDDVLDAIEDQKRYGEHVLVVIDSIHAWTQQQPQDGRRLDEYESLNAALALLQQIANMTKSPVIVLAEMNREAVRAGAKSEDSLTGAAGTRAFEYKSETVLWLADPMGTGDRRTREYTPQGHRRMELVLSKNRHAPTADGLGVVPLVFDRGRQTFTVEDREAGQ